MQIKKPLISILIATRNRQKYAFNSVISILRNEFQDFEIIVQDNSDGNELKNQLDQYKNDHRLIYNYTKPPFSSIENFCKAIELSSGKYICCIGDDDGINPYIFEILKIINDHDEDIQCIVGSLSLNYRWPESGLKSTFFTDTSVGGMDIWSFTNKIKFINPKESIDLLLRSGGCYYLRYKFPKFYHGIVRRDVLEDIKRISGKYIGGLSPDIYLAIAISLNTSKFLFIDYPLTIPGVCKESSSATEGGLKMIGRAFSNAPHFRDNLTYQRNKEIPDVYCLETIWADSALSALKDFKRYDLIKELNIPRLLGNILSEHSTLDFKFLLNKRNYFMVIMYMTLNKFTVLKNKIFSRLLICIKLKELKTIKNLDSIDEAVLFYFKNYILLDNKYFFLVKKINKFFRY